MKNYNFKRCSDSYMIALIGKPNVGKSTIIRTGLNNLTPVTTNVGKDDDLTNAPTLLSTEIEVDDNSYPVQVMEIQESVFNMNSTSLEWPKDLPEIDGILVCYDVTSRASIVNIAWLLNAFKEFQVPMILVACKADCDKSERQVLTEYGVKLGDLFHVGFVEIDTRTENGIQKIHDVFSMLLRLSIRHSEGIHQTISEKENQIIDSSSESICLPSASSDAESDQRSSSRNHRRAASDLSHESRGRKKLTLSKYVSTKYNNRLNPSKITERKSRSPLKKFLNSSDDDDHHYQISSSLTRNLSRSLPRSMPFKNTPAISVTPPRTPPTTLILSQMSLPSIPNTKSITTNSSSFSANTFPYSSSPNKHFVNSSSSSERNSNRKSILPPSTLLQVNEAEEERDEVSVRSGNSRVSCCSCDSTLSSTSINSENSLLTWDTLFIGNESFDKNSKKCSGSRGNGMSIEDLVQRLTIGGQYGIDDDPFMVTFFVFYRKFMRPRDILSKLMQKFHECEKDTRDNRNTTHEKICNILYHWMTQHPNDLIHSQTRTTLREFFDIITKCTHLSYYSIILERLVNGTIPEDDPDAVWGLTDIDEINISDSDFIHKDEISTLSTTVTLTGVLKTKTSNNAKKDSGFGGWIFNGDHEGYLSDTVSSLTTCEKQNELSSLSSLLIQEEEQEKTQRRNEQKTQSSSNIKSDNNNDNGTFKRPSLQNHRKASLIIIDPSGSGVRATNQVLFEEFPEKVIANELTFQEFQIFKKIIPRDLLRHIWTPQGSSQRENGRVAKSIKHFNLISNWVSKMILSQEKLKNRAVMMKKFMKIAILVRESNNYNTLMAIIAALNSAPISRLRRTRDLVKNKSCFKKFHNLEVLMSTEKSFSNYRAALKSQLSHIHDEQKGIPYLGIHLQDLLSIGEGNKNYQDDGKIHWNKFSLMGDIIIMMRKFQKSSYNLKSNKFIECFINDMPILSDDDLYNKSLELEPRVRRSASTSRVHH